VSPRQSAPLGDRIIAAHAQSVKADAEFKALLVEARHVGASIRDIAELIDVPPMTLWRWSGGSETHKGRRNVLR